MFDKKTTLSSKVQSYQPGQCLPVLSFQQLTEGGPMRELLQQVREQVSVADVEYAAIYDPLLMHFAEMVQMLPVQFNTYLQGLFYEGLGRGYLALKRLEEQGRSSDAALQYAAFSAALLHEVGRVASHYWVTMLDQDKKPLGRWLPYLGSMHGRCASYMLLPLGRVHYRNDPYASVLLARQLMSATGFAWLVEHQSLWMHWLSSFREDETDGGLIYQLGLIKDEEELWQNLLAQLQESFDLGTEHVDELTQTPLGYFILKWISGRLEGSAGQGIEGGIYATEHGLLVDFEVIRQNSRQADLISIEKELRDMDVLITDQTDNAIIHYKERAGSRAFVTNRSRGEQRRGFLLRGELFKREYYDKNRIQRIGIISIMRNVKILKQAAAVRQSLQQESGK